MPDRIPITPPKQSPFGNPGQGSQKITDEQLRQMAAYTGRNLLTGQAGLVTASDPMHDLNVLINSYLIWLGKMMPFILVGIIVLAVMIISAKQFITE